MEITFYKVTARYFSEPVPQHYCFEMNADLGWGRIGERDVLGWRKGGIYGQSHLLLCAQEHLPAQSHLCLLFKASYFMKPPQTICYQQMLLIKYTHSNFH